MIVKIIILLVIYWVTSVIILLFLGALFRVLERKLLPRNDRFWRWHTGILELLTGNWKKQ